MNQKGNRIGRTRWGLLCGVVGLLLAVGSLSAQPTARPVVAEINVEGNKTLSLNAVLFYVKNTRVGAEYNLKNVKDDQARLVASGRFSRVVAKEKMTPKGVVVTFVVSERPVINELKIEGAKEIKAQTLLSELSFGQGDPFNKASILAGRQTLLNKYQEEGYHFASVNLDESALKKYDVIYKVVEGPKTVVKKVIFDGNHYYNRFSLWMRVDTKAMVWPKTVLNTEKIQRDVAAIRNLYISEGFLDCEVGRELKFSNDKKDVTVIFKIKEGPRYRVNKIIFKGNRYFSDEELLNRLKFHQGSFYTQETLKLDTKKLEATYGQLGYIEARISSRVQYLNPESPAPTWARDLDGGKPALINLVFNIKENEQYRIGTIRIQGNSITKGSVIRRELKFYPEQLCDTVAIDNSKSRLQQLRLFNEVNITPVASKDPGVKDVVVDVTEGKTAEFLVGVGVSSSSGLLGTVSLTQRNFDLFAWPKSWADWAKPTTFKGGGQTLSLQAEPGTEMMRFNLSWFTPYLFDQPYSLGTKAFVYTRERERYDERHIGVQASFGHRFRNRWYGELSTRYENVYIDTDSDAAVEIQDDKGDHNLIGFRGSLIRDTTDSRWMPSKGTRFTMSYEEVVGTETFGKANTEFKVYKTMYIDSVDRKHILAGRVAFGGIVGDAPVFEKFYGGGIGSIRGFKYRGIGPRGHYVGGGKSSDPIGGDMMFFAGTEYTFPIFGDNLRGVLFVDSGTVEADYTLSAYRVSVGAGLRWTIPMFGPVPMSLDFGIPVVKDSEDDTQIFNFSLGWTF